MLLVATVAFATSCQRRGFSKHTTPINLHIQVRTDVQNATNVALPDMMRVDLFNPNTGQVEYTDYISPEGGYISPAPGTYNILVYNIGTESTIVRNEKNIGTVEAYTNEVSVYIKSQIQNFLEARLLQREEKYARDSAANAANSMAPATKDPILEGTERIVNEPDYLWVGRMDNYTIPALALDEKREISVMMEASSVVETWKIVLKPVEGLQWVSKITALITGQTESTYIGKDEDSQGVATIYFEMQKDEDNKCIVGTFNTFGKNPLYSSFLSLDLNIIDELGDEHHYTFDITDGFFENNEFIIEVENPIVVEEPKVQGGGFQPTVGDWKDVITDIIL